MIAWHNKFMSLAKEISTWSKDPNTQVGTVAVRNRQILSVGFNGFPRGIEDTKERLNERELKYHFMVHSEMNCIYNASYNGVSLFNASLYVYGLPVCSECAKGIIQVGIKEVYWKCDKEISEKWENSMGLSMNMFKETSILFERL